MPPRQPMRVVLLSLLFAASSAHAQFAQQGPKLSATGSSFGFQQGLSGALSADGNTAIAGGAGAVWMYTRGNGVWSQQGPKLAPADSLHTSFGLSVALSADGNTAIVGGPFDASRSPSVGAVWVFARAGGVWSQQAKLIPSDASATTLFTTQAGSSVALSADGNTALVGGPGDNQGAGAVWVFTRANGAWTQQGNKLVGNGAVSPAAQGSVVALSADGNTALVGGPVDHLGLDLGDGAAWVFTRTNGVWTQQGDKLFGTGATPSVFGGSAQGSSVALSADGNTAIIGAPRDEFVRLPDADPTCTTMFTGAAWVFTRSKGAWSQQGGKLVGSGTTDAEQGTSVKLSADGNLVLVGGPQDNRPMGTCYGTGATWVYLRHAGVWSQQGGRLVGSAAVSSTFEGSLQQVVGLSADGSTALIGGPGDNGTTGAVWFFTQPAATHLSVSAPSSAAGGAPVNFTVIALDSTNNPFPGYSGTVHFTSTDAAAALPADATLVNGSGVFSATFANGGSQTITAADTLTSTITGTSGAIAVNVPVTHLTVSAPASVTAGVAFNFTVSALGYSGTVHFTSTDGAAVLPANATIVNGSGAFTATLHTPGSQSITATDTVTATLGGTSGAIVVSPAASPAPVSVTISNSTYTLTYSDPRGYQDLDVLNILVNNFLDGRHACYLAYVMATNSLVLVDDAGDAGGPYAGAANSQCAVNLVSAMGSGNNLTLVMTITWTTAFAGDKIVHMAARDAAQNNSGWQPMGVVRVPGAIQTTATAVVSMSPNQGSGPGPTAFTFNWSDSKGFGDLGVENILVNGSLDGRHACYLAFSQPGNVVYLENDNGDGLLPGQSLAAAGSLANSQCTVTWAANPVTASGNNLSLALNIAFTAAFAGKRVIYVAARDVNEANNTDWHAMGTWTR